MANANKVIAVDLGSTYFKICRFDETGELEAVESVAAPIERRGRGRAEISVAEFGNCLSCAIRRVAVRDGQGANVGAITFSTQANTFALFDRFGKALTPFVLWSDTRAEGAGCPLEAPSANSAFRAKTGVAAVNHLFMPAKVHWFRQHEADMTSRVSRLSLLSDYFTEWLTGTRCTEAATAA